MRPVWAEVSLKAIAENIKTLKGLTRPGVLFMAVVKADGYGHGAVPVARAALEAGADRLGVALAEEGVELRREKIEVPIQILSEISPDEHSLEQVVENNLMATLCQREVAQALSKAAQAKGKSLKVHIKVDTGMNRLGLPADPMAVYEFVRFVGNLPNLEIEGIFTHFALADRPENNFTTEQFGRFKAVLDKLEQEGVKIPLKHAANSAAIIAHPETHLDMVRAGISLYGLPPSPELAGRVGLNAALSLKARISYLKEVSAGQGVSYGHTHITEGTRKIATLPLGYADGYSRLLSNKSEVLVEGKRVRGIGTICMDQFMIDVTDVPAVSVGKEVVLIGKQGSEEITADELANLLDTINYEVVCMISKRVPRIYT